MKKCLSVLTCWLLLVGGCGPQHATPSEPTPAHAFEDHSLVTDFKLQCGGFVDCDTLFADNADVYIDDTVWTKTDSNGVVKYASLTNGPHTIRITHRYFATFVGGFTAANSSYQYISLIPAVADFFPLIVGAQWVYLHSYEAGEGSSYQWGWYSDSGITTWTIVGVSRGSSGKVFSVDARYHRTGGTMTGTVDSSQGSFSILESFDHRITIQADYTSPMEYLLFDNAKTILDQCVVYRYNDKNVGNEVNCEGDSFLGLSTATVRFRMTVGLVLYSASTTGMTSGQSDYYDLRLHTNPSH